MNKLDSFKVDEEVWCVGFYNGVDCPYEPGFRIWADRGTIETCEVTGDLIAVQGYTILSDENHTHHKSKNDAIDEIILALMMIKDKT